MIRPVTLPVLFSYFLHLMLGPSWPRLPSKLSAKTRGVRWSHCSNLWLLFSESSSRQCQPLHSQDPHSGNQSFKKQSSLASLSPKVPRMTVLKLRDLEEGPSPQRLSLWSTVHKKNFAQCTRTPIGLGALHSYTSAGICCIHTLSNQNKKNEVRLQLNAALFPPVMEIQP